MIGIAKALDVLLGVDTLMVVSKSGFFFFIIIIISSLSLCLFVFEGCRVNGKECLYSQKVSFLCLEFLNLQFSNHCIIQAVYVISSRSGRSTSFL